MSKWGPWGLWGSLEIIRHLKSHRYQDSEGVILRHCQSMRTLEEGVDEHVTHLLREEHPAPAKLNKFTAWGVWNTARGGHRRGESGLPCRAVRTQ